MIIVPSSSGSHTPGSKVGSVIRVLSDEGSGRTGIVVSLHMVGSQCSGWELFAN